MALKPASMAVVGITTRKAASRFELKLKSCGNARCHRYKQQNEDAAPCNDFNRISHKELFSKASLNNVTETADVSMPTRKTAAHSWCAPREVCGSVHGIAVSFGNDMCEELCARQ